MTTSVIDWVAIATAGGAILTVAFTSYATNKTIRAQAAQNRKQQLADMMSTALSHFTGKSQNRGVGIAALRMVQDSAADLTMEGILSDDELKLYRNSIQMLLYGQLLYLYLHGENRDKAHEAANILAMSKWLFSDYIDKLKPKQKDALYQAMKKYKEYVKCRTDEPVIGDLIAQVSEWTT